MKKSGLPLLYTVLLSAGTASVAAQAEVIDGAPVPEIGTAEQTRIDTADYSVHGMLAADESDNDDDLLINEEYLAKVRAQEAAVAGGSNVSSVKDPKSALEKEKALADGTSASDLKSGAGNKASASKGSATGKADTRNDEQRQSEAATDSKVSESRPDVIASKLEANKAEAQKTKSNQDDNSSPVASSPEKYASNTQTLTSGVENSSPDVAKPQALKNAADSSAEKTSDTGVNEQPKTDKNTGLNEEAQASIKSAQEEQGSENTTDGNTKNGAPVDAGSSADAKVNTKVADSSKDKSSKDKNDSANAGVKSSANGSDQGSVTTKPDDKSKGNADLKYMASASDDIDSIASSNAPKAKSKEAVEVTADKKQNSKTGPDSIAKTSDVATDKSGKFRQGDAVKDADSIDAKESQAISRAQNSATSEDTASDSAPDNNGLSGDKSSKKQGSQKEQAENKNTNASNTGTNANKDTDKSTNVKADASRNLESKDAESKLELPGETKNKDTVSVKKSANDAGGKAEATNAEPGLYTRAYLENMYLPFFYHSYDLPQQLNHSLILRRVRLADEGVRLVYEIGIDSSMGPMDLDGEPVDNRILQLFCRIAMGDGGVLHRSQGLVLEFFHGNDAFFSKNLTYKSCTGKDVGLVRRSTTEQEQGRLDDEFVYAYQESMHKDGTLTRGYLEKYFVPYALERIPENFAKVEDSRELTLGKGTELLLRFELKPEDKRKVAAASFVTDRIRRTCRIGTYAEWVLPYINGIRYEYRLPDGTVVRSVSVDNATCAAMKDGSVH